AGTRRALEIEGNAPDLQPRFELREPAPGGLGVLDNDVVVLDALVQPAPGQRLEGVGECPAQDRAADRQQGPATLSHRGGPSRRRYSATSGDSGPRSSCPSWRW